MPEESEFLCGDWIWDPMLRELRHYERKRKGHADEPDAVERLEAARSVTWHRWSQAPMQAHTGGAVPGPTFSRVVVKYEDGRKLDINETDRACAEKLAGAIAEAYRLPMINSGAPDGRRGGNLPKPDAMGRLISDEGRTKVVLDETAGEIQVSQRGRFVGSKKRAYRTSEIRRLELAYEVRGSVETFSVRAVLGPEEERMTVASYTGYEGWADPGEWRTFAEELARGLGAPLEPGAMPDA